MDIDERNLEFLSKQDWPVTSEAVERAVNLSRNTAQLHLWKLVSEGKVRGKRVGRQNQWILAKR